MTDSYRWRVQDLRILLADEEGFEGRKLAADLSRLGCDVSVQSRLQVVRETLRKERIDFVAVNPMLSAAGWYHFLHEVRQSIRQLPWVVITDSPSSSLAVESIKLGACDVLGKPVTATELLSVFRGSPARPAAVQGADMSLAQLEWEHLNRVIRDSQGNVSDAARKLGLSRQTLYNKLRKARASGCG